MKRITSFETINVDLAGHGIGVKKIVYPLSSFTDQNSKVDSCVSYIYSLDRIKMVVTYKMNHNGSIYGITNCCIHDDTGIKNVYDMFVDGLHQNLCLSKVFDAEYQNTLLEKDIANRVIKYLKRG